MMSWEQPIDGFLEALEHYHEAAANERAKPDEHTRIAAKKLAAAEVQRQLDTYILDALHTGRIMLEIKED